jgi:hypothetical protein
MEGKALENISLVLLLSCIIDTEEGTKQKKLCGTEN